MQRGQEQTQVRPEDLAFNSLFEMHNNRRNTSAHSGEYSFNSLFEMRGPAELRHRG